LIEFTARHSPYRRAGRRCARIEHFDSSNIRFPRRTLRHNKHKGGLLHGQYFQYFSITTTAAAAPGAATAGTAAAAAAARSLAAIVGRSAAATIAAAGAAAAKADAATAAGHEFAKQQPDRWNGWQPEQQFQRLQHLSAAILAAAATGTGHSDRPDRLNAPPRKQLVL